MICWSIDAARASGCFTRIVVSTDDDEVAAVARDAGAEVPFRRPSELANDHTPTVPVIAHAVQWLSRADQPIDEVCCIYATAPLIEATDLVRGRDLRRESAADYAFSCTSFPFPVQRALTRDTTGRITPMFPEFIASRSQDLAEAIHDAGQFYWGTADAFLSQRPIFGPASVALMIPRCRVQDIDTEEDWTQAELLFRAYKDT